MNPNKVCFIMCVNDERWSEESILYINNLHKPDGIEIEIRVIYEATSMASAYNKAMRESDAQYKVYLHQDLLIINPYFISDIIKIFNMDQSIGLLGVIGAKSLPGNAIWWEGHKVGRIYDSHTNRMELLSFEQPGSSVDYVEAIDGCIMITQYDIEWNEEVCRGWHYYDISQCIEFSTYGLKIAIPQQFEPWCVHDSGIASLERFNESREKFLEYYEWAEPILCGKQFFRVGKNSAIDPSCDLFGSVGIQLGRDVIILRECWLMLPYENITATPRIIIGDGTNIGRRTNISAIEEIVIGKNVIIASNVHISDHNHEYKYAEIPIMHQGVTWNKAKVNIGDGSWIGINAVIVGNVTIGKNCVIAANSFVNKDIPDYCVAAGSPAKVIKMLDYSTGEWLSISDEKELEIKLNERSMCKPLISICIPTFNRAQNLKLCLDSILCQVGNSPLVEVIVSDNNSDDFTQSVLRSFSIKYKNLIFWRNDDNIGAEKNILKVIKRAKGCFTMLHGDDDYFLPNTLQNIVNIVYANRECGLIFLDVLNDSNKQLRGEGASTYLREASIYSTFISSLILKTDTLQSIVEIDKFEGSLLNQVFIQYKVLENNPRFCIYKKKIFSWGANIPHGYNFAEVFIENYLSILESFLGSHFSEEDINDEKVRMIPYLLTTYNFHLTTNKNFMDNFEEIIKRRYSIEPYYLELIGQINEIKSRQKELLK
jgi:acetyltransferase-like isoleucine patch superfamily enzyme/glycosyltransferase involved in cell wall biosynthesis